MRLSLHVRALVSVLQLYYPLDCPTRRTGPYSKRFTLHFPWAGQNKVIARSIAVRRCVVQWDIESSDHSMVASA